MLDPSEYWKGLLEDNYSALEGRGYTGSPRSAVERALATLCYAFRLYSSVKVGTVAPEVLSPAFTFGAQGHAYEVVIDKPYSAQQLKDGSWNLVLAALATSASANHRALQQQFGKKSPATDAADELEQAWAILYQLRNAFAHDPFQPVFVPSRGYRRAYAVASLGITCDFAALDGTEFKPDLFGGFDGYVGLVALCLHALR